MDNPTYKLRITKLIVGDSKVAYYDEINGDEIIKYDYYEPTGNEENLKHSVASFYFHGKELDKDNQVVSFITRIPENSSGYMISEMGIYEDENLVALCTLQDIPKPLMDYNYLIGISMKIALHSKNLCNIYDRIELDADNEYLQPADLEQLQYNVLYMEGNLCEQISQNSHIICLNRPRQLQQQIEEDKKDISTIMLNNIYCAMANQVGFDNVKNFWVFDYSRYNGTENTIIDMGVNGEFLNTKEDTTTTNVDYIGLCPSMDFNNNNFYSDESIADTGYKTWFFLLKNDNLAQNAIILAKSNNYTNEHEFEFYRRNNGSLEIRLFTANGNYVSFTTASDVITETMYSVGIKVPSNYKTTNITLVVNGYEIPTTRTESGTLNSIVNSTIGYSSYLQTSENTINYETKSYMGLMAKLSGNLSVRQMKGISLLLTSFGGVNVCMNFR